MRPQLFSQDVLVDLLRRHQMASMPEMKSAIGTMVDMTVFRMLSRLSYVASYSHRGKFYTLKDIADFDERGLWQLNGVHFSEYGSLVATVERWVSRSIRGYLSVELAAELEVQVKEPLLHLVKLGRLAREEHGGQYLYCSPENRVRKEQIRRRSIPVAEQPFSPLRNSMAETSDETKAAIILFFSTLDERQRRLYAGLESLRLGHGGDRRLSELIDMDVHTIAKGRKELLAQDAALEQQQARRGGGGRKSVEKKHRKSSRPSRN